jgi:hypothetical protein
MNHILYNLSLMVLCIGIILMTVYVTRATTDKYKTGEQKLNSKPLEPIKNNPDIYTQRFTTVFKNMFSQPSLWQGYQDYGADAVTTQKVYVKAA